MSHDAALMMNAHVCIVCLRKRANEVASDTSRNLGVLISCCKPISDQNVIYLCVSSQWQQRHIRSKIFDDVATRLKVDRHHANGLERVRTALRDLLKACCTSTYVVQGPSFTKDELATLHKREQEQVSPLRAP